MTDLTVKSFQQRMTGAPQISNNWGDLVTMLDACVSTASPEGHRHADLTGQSPRPRSRRDTPTSHIGWCRSPEPSSPSTTDRSALTRPRPTFTLRGDGHAGVAPTTTTSLGCQGGVARVGKAVRGPTRPPTAAKNPQSPQNILLIDDSLKTPGLHRLGPKWANVGIVEDLSDIDTIVGAQAPYLTRTTRPRTEASSSWPVGLVQVVHAHQAATKTLATAAVATVTGCSSAMTDCSSWAPTRPGYGWYGRSSYCFGDIGQLQARRQLRPPCSAPTTSTGLTATAAIQAIRPVQRLWADFVAGLSGKGAAAQSHPARQSGPLRADVPEHQQRPADLWPGPTPFPNGADYSLWLLPTYVRQEDGIYARHPARDVVDAARPALQRSDHRGQRGRPGGQALPCWSGRSTARKPKARRSRSTSPGRGGKP